MSNADRPADSNHRDDREPDTQQGVDEEFVRLLTNCQNRLYIYILSLLPDPERANDVLQETNVVMWRKAADFQRGTYFAAWACRIAYLEVLSERRKRIRDRHLFDDQTLELLSADVEPALDHLDRRAVALDECLQRLNPVQRKRLLDRYTPGATVKDVAAAAGESHNTLAVTLYRIRRTLLRCIEAKLARENQV